MAKKIGTCAECARCIPCKLPNNAVDIQAKITQALIELGQAGKLTEDGSPLSLAESTELASAFTIARTGERTCISPQVEVAVDSPCEFPALFTPRRN